MKVLYAIQGTGNGHISRAREIVPLLEQMCDLDLLISGIQADVTLSQKVKYQYKGVSFIFGKKGGVDIWQTYARNKIKRIWKEYCSFPAEQYDLIINDFEPISAWAARKKGIPCTSLSHQCAVAHPSSPKPTTKDIMGQFILNHYAPTDHQHGFHFDCYAPRIYTPVIRREIRQLNPTNKGHYTVYLPAYDDQALTKHLSRFDVSWHVFSKHNKQEQRIGNIYLRPVDNEAFIHSLETCEGILCGAGFEAPAEALFLGKKVLAIPMKGQYEQHCNAAAMQALGIPVIPKLGSAYYTHIEQWINDPWTVSVNYPNEVADILERVLTDASIGIHI